MILFFKNMPTLDVSHLSLDYILTGIGILCNNLTDGWMLRNGSVKSLLSWIHMLARLPSLISFQLLQSRP